MAKFTLPNGATVFIGSAKITQRSAEGVAACALHQNDDCYLTIFTEKEEAQYYVLRLLSLNTDYELLTVESDSQIYKFEWRYLTRIHTCNEFDFFPLAKIVTAVKAVLQTSEVHKIRRDMPERILLNKLMQLERVNYILPVGKQVPQLLWIVLAIFSSFTMASASVPLTVALLGMLGALIFNLFGGVNFPGIRKEPASITHFILGFISAVAPAVLTYDGAVKQGLHPVFGAITGLSNLFLSATLGTIGVSSIKEAYQDFMRGGYSPYPKMEFFFYALMALTVTATRAGPTAKFMYKGDDLAKIILSNLGAGLSGLPECAMFCVAYLDLRIKITESLKVQKRDHAIPMWLCDILAIALAVSFFWAFWQLGGTVFTTYSQWFQLEGHEVLKKILTYLYQFFSASGAAALIVSGGNTIYKTIVYLGDLLRGNVKRTGEYCLARPVIPEAKAALPGDYVVIDMSGMDEETPLLLSTAADGGYGQIHLIAKEGYQLYCDPKDQSQIESLMKPPANEVRINVVKRDLRGLVN